jgi:hypothetical protein
MRFIIPVFFILSTVSGLTSEARAQAWHIKTACVGTKNKDDRGTAYNMIQNNDKAGLAQMLEDGEIIFLEAGTVCYPVHNADFWTNWQIRVSGQPGLWWVSVEDLENPASKTEQKNDETPAPTSDAQTQPEAGPIPDPTDEQATAAFNDLQDQFHRPHVKSVVYDATIDSYRWIGPKTGKKMSMKRSQFIAEIWTGYYKKINGPTQ